GIAREREVAGRVGEQEQRSAARVDDHSLTRAGRTCDEAAIAERGVERAGGEAGVGRRRVPGVVRPVTAAVDKRTDCDGTSHVQSTIAADAPAHIAAK